MLSEAQRVSLQITFGVRPIPSEYHVILPKSNQTIFDAPPRFIYRGSTLLVVPSSPLLLSCAKLMVMGPLSTSSGGFSVCVELPIPSEYHVILPKSNQTIFDAPPRSEKRILNLLPKVITSIEGWHERFFYVQDFIIPAKYPQLLSEQNKLDSKSFKDKHPLNIEENPMFQRLDRYPTSVRVFSDPILFLAGLKPLWKYEMDFGNFIYIEDDKDLSFLPKEPSLGFRTGSPSVLINTKPLKANKEPVIQPREVTADSGESLKSELFVVHLGSVAARIKDPFNPLLYLLERTYKTLDI
nr:hypothetical protein [Tanacetum cinerariifolium]